VRGLRRITTPCNAIALEKRDKTYTVNILKDYLKVDDTQALSDAYDYFAGDKTPSVPLATVDQCKESVNAVAATNEQLRRVDVSRFIDNEFVRAAAREKR
jgi:hypothetical protein